MMPRIAVGPAPEPWAVAAVVEGGGEPVGLDGGAIGLVWTDFFSSQTEELRRVLQSYPSINWVQLPLAGVDRMFEAEVIDRRRRWTSAKGAYAEPVAEHALALTLAGLRQLPQRARAESWGGHAGRTLYDRPVTVVGAGGITDALIRLLTPFRTDITVVRQRPVAVAGARRTLVTGQLRDALGTAQVVVLALALTPQTRGLIGQAELEAMREDAWLVNVARGALVDTQALVGALRTQSIGGAALDVTDPEPLPTGHPLWRMSNCLITPHTADTPEMTRPLLARRIAENVRRLATGYDLLGLVDPDLGY